MADPPESMQSILNCILPIRPVGACALWCLGHVRGKQRTPLLLKAKPLAVFGRLLPPFGAQKLLENRSYDPLHFFLSVSLFFFSFIFPPPELPEILMPPQNQTIKLGKAFVLECDADGNPLPTIDWQFNGQPLIPGARSDLLLENENTELVVSTARQEHAGK